MSENLGPESAPDNWGTPNPAWNRIGSLSRDWSLNPTPTPQPVPSQTPTVAETPVASMDQYRAPRRRGPLLITLLVVGALLLALGFVASRTADEPETVTTPTPTPAYTPTVPLPTGGQFSNSITFTSSAGAGTLTIDDSRWEDQTLILTVRIEMTSGRLDFSFLAMDMATGDVSIPDQLPGDLPDQVIVAGEQVTGTVRFTKARGDTQVILSDMEARNNVTMLAVKG